VVSKEEEGVDDEVEDDVEDGTGSLKSDFPSSTSSNKGKSQPKKF
jgi:hypothetical protein